MRNIICRVLQALVILAVAASFAKADNFMYFRKSVGGCPAGSYAGGDQETFECSSIDFQTYANGTNKHTVVDNTAGGFSIYDSGLSHGGVHSMGVDVSATTRAYVETDLGVPDTTCSWAFWVYLPSFGSSTWKTIIINEAKLSSSEPGLDPYQSRVVFKRTDPTYYLILYNASGTNQSVTITTVGAWYEVQVDYTYGGNIVMSVWDSVGTLIGTATVAQTGSGGVRYIYHGNFSTGSAMWDSPKMYIDDLKFNPNGGNVYGH